MLLYARFFFHFVCIFVGNDHRKLWTEGLGSWLEEAEGKSVFVFYLFFFSLLCCQTVMQLVRQTWTFKTLLCAPAKLIFSFFSLRPCVQLPCTPTFSLFQVSIEAVPLLRSECFSNSVTFPMNLFHQKWKKKRRSVLVHNRQKNKTQTQCGFPV